MSCTRFSSRLVGRNYRKCGGTKSTLISLTGAKCRSVAWSRGGHRRPHAQHLDWDLCRSTQRLGKRSLAEARTQ